MRGVVFALCLAAGCADPGDGVRFERRVYVTHEDGAFVHGAGWVMHFPVLADQVTAPDSLLVDGSSENVFATGDCPLESLVGTSLYPATLNIAGTAAQESDPSVVWEGPAVVRIDSRYLVPWACSAEGDAFGGQTVWTFFPSGRIVRHDIVSPTQSTHGLAGMCACNQNDQNYALTTFYTFNSTLVEDTGDAVPASGRGYPRVCATVGPNVVGLAWGTGDAANVRANDVKSGTAWASVYDWEFANGSIQPGDREVTSALQIAPGRVASDCGSVIDQLADPQIAVNGMPIPTDANGVFIDRTAHDTVTITSSSVVPPFAVILNLDGATHAKISSSVARDDSAYATQPVDDPDIAGLILFWFDAGLQANETITIDPR